MECEAQLTASTHHQSVPLDCRPVDEPNQHHEVWVTCPAEASPCCNPQDWEPVTVFIWATELSGFVPSD